MVVLIFFSENIIMEQLDFFKKYDNSMYQN